MLKYFQNRLLRLIPVLLVITFITFSLMFLASGDPAQKKLIAQGIAPTEEVLEATRESMGLNDPFLVRYGNWLWCFVQGDLGESYAKGLPVSRLMWNAMGKTAMVAVSALALSLIVSIPLGIWTAVKRNTVADYLVRFLTFLANAVPSFLAALLLIYLFCVFLQWLPVLAKNSFQGLILPTVALAMPTMGKFIKQIRAEVLGELGQNYVTGAQARGVKSGTILVKDVLHNSMLSILTVIGFAVGHLFAGSVVIEAIFQWPGMGKLVMDAITARDYPVIQGFVVYIAIIYVLINLLTDLAYRYFDPRVTES
ncbi:ABC transporter permease [Maridesulfovibrio sp.]|uniref:ABC transporter permease n=1 Tax=Maridesulfovibrio sp. TaxID=2795000 RepID=UPI002A18DC81|nr:ABC transporter permease [Maridesulfovibrio sp.]